MGTGSWGAEVGAILFGLVNTKFGLTGRPIVGRIYRQAAVCCLEGRTVTLSSAALLGLVLSDTQGYRSAFLEPRPTKPHPTVAQEFR